MDSPFSSLGHLSSGFSYLDPGSNAYQFIPLGQSREVWISNGNSPSVLCVVDPNTTSGSTLGRIGIETEARRMEGGPFDVFTLEPNDEKSFRLTGRADAQFVLAVVTPGAVTTPLLYVRVGGPIAVHYAVNVILRDPIFDLPYSEPQLLSLLSEVEGFYALANIRLVRAGPINFMEFKTMALGPQIISDSLQGDAIRRHIKDSRHGHLKNLVYGWDFESKPRRRNAPDRASGLTEFGGNVSMIDWGGPAMVTAHELGHALRLIDRPAGDDTIMQPTVSSSGFLGWDCSQIEILRIIARQTP